MKKINWKINMQESLQLNEFDENLAISIHNFIKQNWSYFKMCIELKMFQNGYNPKGFEKGCHLSNFFNKLNVNYRKYYNMCNKVNKSKNDLYGRYFYKIPLVKSLTKFRFSSNVKKLLPTLFKIFCSLVLAWLKRICNKYEAAPI